MSKILLPLINFTERKRIKSRTRFSAKSTQNLKICMKTTHFLIVFLNILASFWHCRVTPYSGEILGLLLHTSETRSLPRVATKRSTANSTQNTDDWKKQVQTTETKTHATHATHATNATHITHARNFCNFCKCKNAFSEKKLPFSVNLRSLSLIPFLRRVRRLAPTESYSNFSSSRT